MPTIRTLIGSNSSVVRSAAPRRLDRVDVAADDRPGQFLDEAVDPVAAQSWRRCPCEGTRATGPTWSGYSACPSPAPRAGRSCRTGRTARPWRRSSGSRPTASPAIRRSRERGRPAPRGAAARRPDRDRGTGSRRRASAAGHVTDLPECDSLRGLSAKRCVERTDSMDTDTSFPPDFLWPLSLASWMAIRHVDILAVFRYHTVSEFGMASPSSRRCSSAGDTIASNASVSARRRAEECVVPIVVTNTARTDARARRRARANSASPRCTRRRAASACSRPHMRPIYRPARIGGQRADLRGRAGRQLDDPRRGRAGAGPATSWWWPRRRTAETAISATCSRPPWSRAAYAGLVIDAGVRDVAEPHRNAVPGLVEGDLRPGHRQGDPRERPGAGGLRRRAASARAT